MENHFTHPTQLLLTFANAVFIKEKEVNEMQQKICPLLTRSVDKPVYCLGACCAWWRSYYSEVSSTGGACALLDIARSID